jgi:phosphoribosyl-ATP pyrophosphohydrolase/phosphoribosyl-AMP cyclohydrolase
MKKVESPESRVKGKAGTVSAAGGGVLDSELSTLDLATHATAPEVLRFDPNGLIPAIVQDADSGAVLMLAYMDREALDASLATGEVHFHSRSRGVLWRKGETSGNVLRLASIVADCDGDALLVLARPAGPTCHTGETTCFHRPITGHGARGSGLENDAAGVRMPEGINLTPLFAVLRDRLEKRPEGSYTVRLLENEDRPLKKLIEEAGEVALAVKNRDHDNLTWELADVLYHLAVIMVAHGVAPAEVNAELARRAGESGR